MAPATPRTTFVEIDGPKLRQLRLQAGVTMATLAAAIGIDQPRLSRIETGQASRVRPDTFRAICEHFGIARDDRWQLMVNGRPWQTVGDTTPSRARAVA